MATKQQLKTKDWRINNLYKIVDKAGQQITFKKNRAQTDFDKNKHNRNIILKSRQLGFTTFEAIDSLDDTLWTPNYKALMLSYDKDSAIEIFDDKIIFAWDNYPGLLKGLYKLDADRANKLKFDFGEKNYSSIIVRNKGRSGTFQRIHISEFAKICKESPRKAKEIVTGTLPSAPYHARLDIESTAEGEEGYFYEMFWESWDQGEPKSPLDFKAHFYNWTWDDEELAKVKTPLSCDKMEQGARFEEYAKKHNLTDIQITYYYQRWKGLGKKWNLLMQEYPTTPEEAFISSGHKLFDTESISALKVHIKEGKKQGSWVYYENYKPNHLYAVGCDVAEGVGQDSSTIVIVDFYGNTPKVVAEFKNNNIAPDIFAHEIKNACRAYGNCIAAVERNSIGLATLTELKKIYHNIYSERKYDEWDDKKTNKLGWHTNTSTKPKMMYDLNTAINEESIIIPSRKIINELRTYDKEDLSQIRFDYDQTRHWDLLIALAIAYQMRTFTRIKKSTLGRNKAPVYK